MANPWQSRDLWLSLLLVLALLASLAFFALGAYLGVTQQEFVILGLGLIAVIVSAAGLAMTGRQTMSDDLADALDHQNELLASIDYRLLLSDQAKRVASRRHDRDALREAIKEDLQREDYDTATVLVDLLASAYGYREEAERFRTEIARAQKQKREQTVNEALARIDQLGREGNWEQAHQEADRLQRLYPDHPGVDQLPQRVAEARQNRKAELEREFLHAAEREDVEEAMELMKQLDRYLTAEEAAPFIETARGVVGKKRENLGVRFKMAVQDRDWIAALNVGEQIVREFPNSKMADEVRGMTDQLRERAAQQRATMADEA